MNEISAELNEKFKNSSIEELLKYFYTAFDSNKVVFTSSLGAEDQVLTDIISKINPEIQIITIDTGRLFYETYNLIEKTKLKYNLNLKLLFPDKEEVEKMVNEKGINLFYESIEKRRQCCEIRKINSLKRAISGVDVWITGLRKNQSVTRTNFEMIEWNDEYKILKVNPLINWSEEDVWNYIRLHKVPYNELHNKNYPSIGCQPCTRAISEGDDLRSGRWWWENPEHKECGLHQRKKI